MNEFSAAIGCFETDRVDDSVTWKNKYAEKNLNPQYTNRVICPENMTLGPYNYIVIEEIEKSKGMVYNIILFRIFIDITGLIVHNLRYQIITTIFLKD